jgi:hypothetical protein
VPVCRGVEGVCGGCGRAGVVVSADALALMRRQLRDRVDARGLAIAQRTERRARRAKKRSNSCAGAARSFPSASSPGW